MAPGVSIIIPNYNRADLILETLESIQRQSYEDWECIIIDDHSTDNSFEVLQSYIKKDQRFKVILRPQEKPKGAASCRNYGFSISRGRYIKWFDSDDIMTHDHLSVQVNVIENKGVDFVVGESINFRGKLEFLGKPFDYKCLNNCISPYLFGVQAIGWITDDFLAKREVLETLKFNEKFTNGDEYNFFTQLLHQTARGKYVRQVITYRRIHNKNLSFYGNSDTEFNLRTAAIKFLTYKDIEKYKNVKLLKWFLSGYMQYSYKLTLAKKIPPYLLPAILEIRKNFGFFKAASFYTSVCTGFLMGKGYRFLREAIN